MGPSAECRYSCRRRSIDASRVANAPRPHSKSHPPLSSSGGVMRWSPFGIAALTLPLLLASACSDAPSTAPRAARQRGVVTDVSSALWSAQIEGVDDGAAYAIFRPTNWNGGVVYYAHGIIDPALPVALPVND